MSAIRALRGHGQRYTLLKKECERIHSPFVRIERHFDVERYDFLQEPFIHKI